MLGVSSPTLPPKVLTDDRMGGLLIADAARDIAVNTRPGAPMWPHVVGVLAFDTPYLGLHPHTFKHGLSTAASYYEQARGLASAAGFLSPLAVGWGASKWGSKTPENASAGPSRTPTPSSTVSEDNTPAPKKSSWLPAASTKTLYGAAAMALGAAAVGTAYYRREDFLNGWKWGFEHMTFVKNLWDDAAMKARLEGIDELGRDRKVVFRKLVGDAFKLGSGRADASFCTHLPRDPPANLISRTFCILPPTTHPLYSRFIQASNTLAKDEVSAHMGMFNPKTNDGFYDLGLAVVRCIGERIEEEGVGKVGEVPLDGMGDEEAEKGGVDGMEGWKEETQGGKVVWVEQ